MCEEKIHWNGIISLGGFLQGLQFKSHWFYNPIIPAQCGISTKAVFKSNIPVWCQMCGSEEALYLSSGCLKPRFYPFMPWRSYASVLTMVETLRYLSQVTKSGQFTYTMLDSYCFPITIVFNCIFLTFLLYILIIFWLR